jgi:hypothetical protein
VGLPEDKAYIAHHFNCPTCCAAGLSGGKQARCADGLQLWDTYNQAAIASQPQNNKKSRRESLCLHANENRPEERKR